ncbi:ABC transporter permease [Helicobacter pylori]|nr:ABC transporter permease [Helicobacter pylori]
MGAILSILKLEIKSYLTNTSALFWTFIYPILMLLLLIFVFSKNTTEIFYFNNIIGLMGLLIISSAIFGLTQAITSSRSHNIFLFYMLSPATFKQITLALIASRLIVVILYAFIFIVLSFYALNIITILNFKALILGFVSVFSSALFCFCLAIFVARIFQNEQSILGFCNIINLYVLMSCNVFVPLEYLPNIGQLFIKTSIFYYLNQLLIKAFQGIDIIILVLATSTFFIIGGIILFLLSANRMLLTPKERMR